MIAEKEIKFTWHKIFLKSYSIRYLQSKLVEKEVVEVATKVKEVKEFNAEVELPDDKVTLELLLNTKECVVL